jgi:hypothetical protein
MSDIVLHEPLASYIRDEAQAQGVEVEQLISAALRRYRFQMQEDKIKAESAWWQSLPLEARAGFAGAFVAIHGQEVVDHDPDEEALRKRIRKRFGKTAVLITPAEGRREFHIVSTRSAAKGIGSGRWISKPNICTRCTHFGG